MNDERFLDAEELGERLGVGKGTIYRMLSKGLIPAIAVGPRLSGRRFHFSAVCAALEKIQTVKRRYHPPKKDRQAVTA